MEWRRKVTEGGIQTQARYQANRRKKPYTTRIHFIISQARLKGFSLAVKKPDRAKSRIRSWPDDPVSPTPILQLVFPLELGYD